MTKSIIRNGLVVGIIFLFIGASLFSSAVCIGSGDPPVADADGPYYGNVGDVITFDGSDSYDPDGWIISWEWDFGDGNTGSGEIVTHSYCCSYGTYTVKLTVIDNEGKEDDDTTYSYINAYPDADAGGPYYADVEEVITFDGSDSYDIDGVIVSWQWNFGDGNSGSGETTTHSYSDSGNYWVTLTVTDDDSVTDTETTKAYINTPPYPPGNPIPKDAATDVDTNVDLRWTGGDPNSGDTVTYDVYFGSMPPFEKVASNISVTMFDPGILGKNLTYYWYIIAWDNHGASNNGPGWHFTTAENQPPEVPEINGPSSGKPGIEYTFCIIVTDPDGDDFYVKWNWGDGTSSDWLGPFVSGMEICDSHIWNEKGIFTISVTVRDVDGESGVTAYKEVTMPRSKAINPFFQWFHQKYPILSQILQMLLQQLELRLKI